MTDRVMQISFLPQDIELIRKFLYDKTYSDSVSYNESLDAIYVNLSKVEKHEIVLSRITELIVSIIKDRDLKEYIWNNYRNLNNEEKEEIYREAKCLLDKKEPFIINTIYNKLVEFIESEKVLNIDGFFRFRMRDFMVYISIISDIAFEEYLIRKDKNQFINTLKFFIESQEQKIDLLIIHIMRNGDFRFYDKYGDEINNKESEEMMSMIMKEDLNLEDCLISVLLSLCPKKVEIIDDLKNETSKEIIENMYL